MAERVKADRGVIHPSIDGLVALIQDGTKGKSEEELTRLRESCRNKLRSYSLEAYLKRYATEPERIAARSRWEIVAAFAHRQERV